MRFYILAIGFVLVCFCACGAAQAECIDYGRYLHWATSLDLPRSGGGSVHGEIAISGTNAFVATAYVGLQVVDISDPLKPDLLALLPTDQPMWGIAVSGTYAYICTRLANWTDGLLVVDVADPREPRSVANVPLFDSPSGIEIEGPLAYVADSWGGLQIVDISDPLAPTVIGGIRTEAAWDVAVLGHYAFLADGRSLLTIDVADPQNPQIVSSMERPRYIRKLELSGDDLYLSEAEGSGGFIEIVDVADPLAPALVGAVAAPAPPFDVRISGDHAYVAVADRGGFMVLDIADTSNPQIVGIAYAGGGATDVDIRGTFAFVTDGNWRLHVIDIAHPQSPPIIGTYQDDGYAFGITVREPHAYVAEGLPGATGRLKILDVSDPQVPTVAGMVDLPAMAYDVTVSGDHAYVAARDLFVIDTADPTDPRILGIADCGMAMGVAVEGGLAYVACYAEGVKVVDIADPQNPAVIGAAVTAGWPLDVAGSGDNVYAAEDFFDGGVQTIDVSDPYNPHVAGNPFAQGTMDAGGSAGVAVMGAQAYFTGGPLGLRVMDISNPEAPAIIGRLHVGTPPEGQSYLIHLTASGDLVYAGGTGLQVVDARDPRNPRLVGNAWAGAARSVTTTDSYVYVASQWDGIRILPLQCDWSADVTTDSPSSSALGVFPNPTTREIVLRLTLASTTRVHLTIFDVSGRRVRDMDAGLMSAGPHDVPWDCLDASGHSLPPGAYWVRMDTGDTQETSRIVILR